jgi:hypothetical protein
MPWRFGARRRYKVAGGELHLGTDAEVNESIVGTTPWPVEVMTELGQGRLPANTMPIHAAAGIGPVGGPWHGIQVGPHTGLIVKDAEVARRLARRRHVPERGRVAYPGLSGWAAVMEC